MRSVLNAQPTPETSPNSPAASPEGEAQSDRFGPLFGAGKLRALLSTEGIEDLRRNSGRWFVGPLRLSEVIDRLTESGY